MGERPRTWQQAERRALVADLVRTQGILQARSEQLQEIFASRWYRFARFTWRLRRGSIFRKASPPKMAGEDSFVRSLDGAVPGAEEAEVRLVPSPSGGGVAVDHERRRWLAEARMPALEEMRVAAILDRVTEACLAPECDLQTGFGADDWRERLEANPPHLLLVESAWAGNGGGWTGAVSAHPGSPQAGLPALRELVDWCRRHGIPSAFWATQDPLAFDSFAEAAALFDHLFTVDADRLSSYRELPGMAAGTVAVLPLAAQPRLHNPVTRPGEPHPGPAYIGDLERRPMGADRRALAALLDAARPFGLVAYEQDAGEGRSYEETVDLYKRHPLFLNASPSPTSPTALSRQIFELLACGTAVLSTPSAAVEGFFGDLVPVAADREEATAQLERLLGDDEHRRLLAARGQQQVLGAHTYRDRLAELTATVGFDVPVGTREETAALVATVAAGELEEAVDSLLAQSLTPDEVLVGQVGEVTEGRALDRLAAQLPSARIRMLTQDGDATRSQRLRELARLASVPWVAPIAPTLRYAPDHLRDLVACTRFAEAEVIGFAPTAALERGEGAHRYTDAVAPHAALATRDLVAARGWPRDETEMRGWFAHGVRIYAGDHGAPAGAPE